ncbi:MAG TPA: TIGR03915 family putative DNA repair protein [Bacteroidales bacterium]|nr:TIGR03915 family putative DNA repair protein [Bacteroidales bacterium]
MKILLYDKTFEGFLSLIFDSFKDKIAPDRIEGFGWEETVLWAEKMSVATDPVKAGRVWEGLRKRLTARAYNAVYRIQLSGVPDSEMILFRFLQKVFATTINIEENYSDPDVLKIKKLDKQICQEAERMRQFIRFQKTADDIYYSVITPQYNVIPLVILHFQERFADQQWIIYDSRRNYGFYYDRKQTVQITLTSDKINPLNGKLDDDILAVDEQLFQQLWKKYFKAICIEERRNERLQMQHMPKRFWKYLTEKQD